MKLLHQDFKHGLIRLQSEHADDLWYLRLLIEPGDRVRALGERKQKIGDADADRNVKVVRRRITLTITVEKVEFTADRLRIAGTIAEGPDDLPIGAHHTLTIEPGDQLTLTKPRWPVHQRRRLDEAARHTPRTYLLVLFDREEALLVKLTTAGQEILARERGEVAKKDALAAPGSDFYAQLASIVARYQESLKPERIILASPSFWSEYLQRALPEALRSRSVSATCSAVSEAAIAEVLKRPELAQLLRDERAVEEAKLVERLMEAIAKEKAGYGLDEVVKAVEQGRCSVLLVTEKAITRWREQGVYERVEQVMTHADAMQAPIHVLSTADAVQKVDALGGIACLMRW